MRQGAKIAKHAKMFTNLTDMKECAIVAKSLQVLLRFQIKDSWQNNMKRLEKDLIEAKLSWLVF